MPNESRTVDQRLAEWAKQSGAVVTSAEWYFIAAMRHARANGVGYGWMQLIIEWEWQHKAPHTAWGPESHERELHAAQAELAEVRRKTLECAAVICETALRSSSPALGYSSQVRALNPQANHDEELATILRHIAASGEKL